MSAKTKQMRAERAAALLAERERSDKRRQQLTVIGVVLGLVLIVGVGFGINRLRDSSNDVSAAVDTAGVYGVTIGEAGATHDVVIYEDFLCPICGALETQTSEDLAALAEDGTAQITYRPFILLDRMGDYSERSTAAFGVVLEQAGPEVAKDFHDLLFANQPSEEGPFLDDDELVDLAVQAGAVEDDVRGPIEDLAGADFAKGATTEAVSAGVDSTPTILIDGEVFSDYRSLDDLGPNLIKALTE